MDEKLNKIQRLLDSETTLTLSTADASFTPHSSPLFFVRGAQLQLYWFSSRRTIHSRNCARNPSASVAVYRHAATWREIRGVQMQGTVSVVAASPLRSELAGRYAERFQLSSALRLVMRHSTMYCFYPRWVRYVDNARRFGYKFELEIHPQGVE